MRTTLTLDDELVTKAQALTGLTDKSLLVREALKALIERESVRRLARLGVAKTNCGGRCAADDSENSRVVRLYPSWCPKLDVAGAQRAKGAQDISPAQRAGCEGASAWAT